MRLHSIVSGAVLAVAALFAMPAQAAADPAERYLRFHDATYMLTVGDRGDGYRHGRDGHRQHSHRHHRDHHWPRQRHYWGPPRHYGHYYRPPAYHHHYYRPPAYHRHYYPAPFYRHPPKYYGREGIELRIWSY